MPVVLKAAVGGADSNSYVTVEEAQAYFEARPGDTSAWTGAAAEDVKEAALIHATRRIDQEEFSGDPVKALTGRGDDTQALKWPRSGATDEQGWSYKTTVIPQVVKDATCELALAMLAGGFDLTDTGLEGFEEVEVGPVSVRPRGGKPAGSLPAEVVRLLRSVRNTLGSNQFRIQRG